MSLVLPVGHDEGQMRNVSISGPFPLDPDEWDRMIDILEVMRPALVDYSEEVPRD